MGLHIGPDVNSDPVEPDPTKTLASLFLVAALAITASPAAIQDGPDGVDPLGAAVKGMKIPDNAPRYSFEAPAMKTVQIPNPTPGTCLTGCSGDQNNACLGACRDKYHKVIVGVWCAQSDDGKQLYCGCYTAAPTPWLYTELPIDEELNYTPCPTQRSKAAI